MPEPAQKCGAVLPRLKDPGWECTGAGLIVVSRMRNGTLPIVLPRRALEIIDPEVWWDDPIVSFTGGDHVHLRVPRTPAGYQKTDSVLVWGDLAYPAVKLGPPLGDGFQFLDIAADDPFRLQETR